MFKKILTLVVFFVLLMTTMVAEAAVDVNTGVITGIVTSTTVSIRKEMDVKADRYCSLKNGDEVIIAGETGAWYIIDLRSPAIGQVEEGYGYALKKYINVRAYWFTLPNTVTLWADTWGSGVANGEKTAGTTMLVLSENSQWLCVQTRDTSAGSSFIRKADLNQGSGCASTESTFVTEGDAGAYVVTANTLAVRSEPNDDQKAIGFLHNGDVVEVIRWGDYFSSIKYTWAGQVTECWVHSVYLKKIYK